MTYREKYQKDYPTAAAAMVHIFQCPKDPNTGLVVDCVPNSGAGACRACWDREMEVTEDANKALPR